MLSCKEVTRFTAGDGLSEAGLGTRLAVRMHRMLCRACRRYAAQIRRLGTWAGRCAGPGPEEAETLERLRTSILDRARSCEEPGAPED